MADDLFSLIGTVLNWNFISNFTIPDFLFNFITVIVVVGYLILYVLTRTNYGIPKTEISKIDIQFISNQDFVVAPLLISSILVFAAFLFSFSLAFLFRVISLIIKFQIDVSFTFYIFFFIMLAGFIAEHNRKSIENYFILHNSWTILKKFFCVSVMIFMTAGYTSIIAAIGITFFSLDNASLSQELKEMLLAFFIFLAILFVYIFFDYYQKFKKITYLSLQVSHLRKE